MKGIRRTATVCLATLLMTSSATGQSVAVLDTWIEQAGTRLLTISDRGSVGSVRLARSESGLSGRRNRDELVCNLNGD